MEIIEKLKNADLRGRGGAAFPTWQKWQMVKDALSADGRKFVVCNVSEGEPGVFKDKFILERWPQTVVDGICLAMTAVGAQKGYIYLRRSYFAEFESKLKKIIGIKPIEVFANPAVIWAARKQLFWKQLKTAAVNRDLNRPIRRR